MSGAIAALNYPLALLGSAYFAGAAFILGLHIPLISDMSSVPSELGPYLAGAIVALLVFLVFGAHLVFFRAAMRSHYRSWSPDEIRRVEYMDRSSREP
jgi:hypothetical protein